MPFTALLKPMAIITKAVVIGFSKAVALELGPKGFRTNTIAPGAVRTPTNLQVLKGEKGLEQPNNFISLGRIGEPEGITDMVAILMDKESRYTNEIVVEVTGGFFRGIRSS